MGNCRRAGSVPQKTKARRQKQRRATLKTIPLTQGYVALVSAQDFARVSAHKWRARVDKEKRTVYAVTGQGQRMHRFIVGATDPTVQIEHKDRNGLNNQRDNLRKCVNGENQANKTKQRGAFTSKFKGVYWDKQCCAFRAKIVIRGRKIYCGKFTDEVQAALAYDEAARKHFGVFALCNFPQEASNDNPR